MTSLVNPPIVVAQSATWYIQSGYGLASKRASGLKKNTKTNHKPRPRMWVGGLITAISKRVFYNINWVNIFQLIYRLYFFLIKNFLKLQIVNFTNKIIWNVCFFFTLFFFLSRNNLSPPAASWMKKAFYNNFCYFLTDVKWNFYLGLPFIV